MAIILIKRIRWDPPNTCACIISKGLISLTIVSICSYGIIIEFLAIPREVWHHFCFCFFSAGGFTLSLTAVPHVAPPPAVWFSARSFNVSDKLNILFTTEFYQYTDFNQLGFCGMLPPNFELTIKGVIFLGQQRDKQNE